MQTLLFTIGQALTLAGPLSAVPVGNAASFTLTAAGGTAPYRIELVSDDFPAEWTLSPTGTEDVTISTSEALEPGTYTFTYRVKDAARNTRLITRSITAIALPLELTGTLDNATRDVAYSDSLTRSGGVGPFTYSVLSGSLPTGLSLDSSTGVVSGTPTVAGDYSFVIRVTDSLGAPADSDTQNLTVVIDYTAARRELRAAVVAFWQFHNSVADSARTGLSWSGTAGYRVGPSGAANTALSADTSADLLTIGSTKGFNALHPSQPFSIVGFGQRRTLTQPSRLLSIRSGGGAELIALKVDAATDKVNLVIGSQTIVSAATILDLNWHHYAAVSDGTNVRLYIDGVLDSTTAISATSIGGTMTAYGLGHSTENLQMHVAQLGYAHAALSADAVAYLYNSGAGRDYSDFSTVAYGTDPDTFAGTLGLHRFHKHNESSGTNANDEGSDNADGTLTNATFTNAIDPPSGFPTSDYVADCNGTTAYIDYPDWDMSSGSKSFTWGCWMYRDTLGNGDGYMHASTNASDGANGIELRAGAADGDPLVLQIFNASASIAIASADNVFTVTTWGLFFGWYDQAADLYLVFANGVTQGAAIDADEPTAVNRTQVFVGRARANLTGHFVDGKFSREYLKRQGTISLANLTKLHDLGNGSG